MTLPLPFAVRFFDRDLSWLSFNSRVLDEAARKTVPLMERTNFLSIYSSNLDEFYRVRMPALLVLGKLSNDTQAAASTLTEIRTTIQHQLERFGKILVEEIIPGLAMNNSVLLFNQEIPTAIREEVDAYFFERVAGYIHLTELSTGAGFFPENNMLYLAVKVQGLERGERYYVLNIPSDQLSRFFSVYRNQTQYIVFLEDIIKLNLHHIFAGLTCLCSYSFKVTRDAELDLKDEFEGNLAKKIEHQITHRDRGLASRFLYESEMPATMLDAFRKDFRLKETTLVNGGAYHNLKDLSGLPVKCAELFYQPWRKQRYKLQPEGILLFEYLRSKEILLNPPYHNYETVIRFFNEAAIDVHVTRIYVTMYRIANDSRIANALINAARNGKKVTVFVELKARFDEANNIKWAKRMKEAGVRILFSIPELKVHAKIALVKRKVKGEPEYYGLLSTGNFNESTARFYTDHILMTSRQELLREIEMLFRFLRKGRKPAVADYISFQHLLVAQFNLQQQFIHLIDREIASANKGLEANIWIKMNNLEDRVLISKLYEASRAGVKIKLLVRSICCLIPGIKDMSENISVTRIVDRYLEHGRIFAFHNSGKMEMFMGSADWMNRNIYRRIEVCFPVYSEILKSQLMTMLAFQFVDTQQGVSLDSSLNNLPLQGNSNSSSQQRISEYLSMEDVNSPQV